MSETSKNRGGRPKVGAIPVTLRLPPVLREPLDAWIDTHPDPKPLRPEAVRLILKDWLTGMGYLRHREDPEGAN